MGHGAGASWWTECLPTGTVLMCTLSGGLSLVGGMATANSAEETGHETPATVCIVACQIPTWKLQPPAPQLCPYLDTGL